jgi:hypothetical protein
MTSLVIAISAEKFGMWMKGKSKGTCFDCHRPDLLPTRPNLITNCIRSIFLVASHLRRWWRAHTLRTRHAVSPPGETIVPSFRLVLPISLLNCQSTNTRLPANELIGLVTLMHMQYEADLPISYSVLEGIQHHLNVYVMLNQ